MAETNATPAQSIWKFPVALASESTVTMPAGAIPLHFGAQAGQPMIWALVWPGNPTEERQFRLFGTGHPIDLKGLAYIGTCFQGPFVWHLFEHRPLAVQPPRQEPAS